MEEHRRELIKVAARGLDKARMMRFDEKTNYMSPTDLGRTSSHFYIKYDTVEVGGIGIVNISVYIFKFNLFENGCNN